MDDQHRFESLLDELQTLFHHRALLMYAEMRGIEKAELRMLFEVDDKNHRVCFVFIASAKLDGELLMGADRDWKVAAEKLWREVQRRRGFNRFAGDIGHQPHVIQDDAEALAAFENAIDPFEQI